MGLRFMWEAGSTEESLEDTDGAIQFKLKYVLYRLECDHGQLI